MLTSKPSDKPKNGKCIDCGVIVKPLLMNLSDTPCWLPLKRCEPCEKKFHIERDKQEKILYRQAALDKNFSDCLLSPINKTMTFENFIVNASNEEIYKYILEYGDKTESVFLTGRCGHGKTHLASALAIRMWQELKNFKFVVVPELLMEIRDTFKKDSGCSELDIIKKYTGTPFLFLDDFGAEKVSEWSLEAIFLLIDTRIREMKPMFITSNLSISEIGKRFNDRIASRIAGVCNILELTDIDHRLKT
jgi:DNA replication protein DnaC